MYVWKRIYTDFIHTCDDKRESKQIRPNEVKEIYKKNCIGRFGTTFCCLRQRLHCCECIGRATGVFLLSSVASCVLLLTSVRYSFTCASFSSSILVSFRAYFSCVLLLVSFVCYSNDKLNFHFSAIRLMTTSGWCCVRFVFFPSSSSVCMHRWIVVLVHLERNSRRRHCFFALWRLIVPAERLSHLC